MLNTSHKPIQDLSKCLRNPSSLNFFTGNQKLLFLSCKVLLMLSWVVHGVALTLACLKDVKLHGVMLAFVPMWHTWLKLFHLNPRWIWSCLYSISSVGCWLSQGLIRAVSLSKWVMLCNSIITLWWCLCSSAQDKYLGRKLPYDDSSGRTCFVTKGASTLAFHFGPGVHFWSESSKWPCLPCLTTRGTLGARKPNSFVWNQTRWCGLEAPAANGNSAHRSMLELVRVNLWHAVT